jgi:hypothetical protein
MIYIKLGLLIAALTWQRNERHLYDKYIEEKTQKFDNHDDMT